MKLKELAKLSPQEKRHAVAQLVAESKSPPNGQMKNLTARLESFEAQFNMSTADMLVAFRSGQLEDSAELAQWLVLSRAGGG